jgi:xanthine phosphoribosyltransferase
MLPTMLATPGVSLLAVSDELKKAIRQHGRVDGDLVMVDGFLNHRVDVGLVGHIGVWLAEALGPCDAVITSEASGIAPAYATAEALGVPMVFAKKRPGRPAGPISRNVHSPTKGDSPWLHLAPHVLEGLHTVVVVDDFLSRGRTALALAEMLEESGLEVTGIGFCIEKAYEGGRDLLEQAGVRVVAAATIGGIEEGRPVVV